MVVATVQNGCHLAGRRGEAPLVPPYPCMTRSIVDELAAGGKSVLDFAENLRRHIRDSEAAETRQAGELHDACLGHRAMLTFSDSRFPPVAVGLREAARDEQAEKQHERKSWRRAQAMPSLAESESRCCGVGHACVSCGEGCLASWPFPALGVNCWDC